MKTLLAASCIAVQLAAQSVELDVAAALARGDRAAAARAVASVAEPARRARLQAALLPAPDRARALLAAARAFPADAATDRALVAAAAAALDGLQRGAAVPELAAWHAVEGSETARDLASTVLGLRDAVAARHAAGGDVDALREAGELLALACVSRAGLWPARVPVGAPWERPAELAEPLVLRVWACEPGELSWARIGRLGAPAWTASLPVSGPHDLPAMVPGEWLLEASSTTSPWRGVRRVTVSDLAGIALAQDGHFAFAAVTAHGPVAARWELDPGDAARRGEVAQRDEAAQQGEVARRGDGAAGDEAAQRGEVARRGDGAAGGEVAQRGEVGASGGLVRANAAFDRHRPLALRLHGDRGSAHLVATEGGVEAAPADARWVAHAMIDRPVHRPGETVLGRIVLHTCRWDGVGAARVPTTAPAPAQAALLRVRLGDAGEVVVKLRTDAHGVAPFTFAMPAEAAPGTPVGLTVELPEIDADGKPVHVDAESIGHVAHYRRQAVELDVQAPPAVAADAPHVDFVLHTTWASGGPAAGIDVRAAAVDRAGREEVAALRTDTDGRATVRVPVAPSGRAWIATTFTVTGPDGHRSHRRHVVEVQPVGAAAAAPAPSRWRTGSAPEIELANAFVGGPCRITLRGSAGRAVLVVVGRGANARVRTLRLDDDGIAALDEPVLRCDWPRFDVVAATPDDAHHGSVPVVLRQMAAVALDVPATAAPGAEVTLRVRSDAPGAAVTFAVVDERVYEIAKDCTPDPNDALRPAIGFRHWSRCAGSEVSSPRELLASLLRHGRLPAIDGGSVGGASSGGAGSVSARPGAPGAMRTRFAPTAHFATVVADARGVAATTFRLPDDLTRWRATAVVIGTDGVGAIARAGFASRQPLAAEPLLPRALREGDTFALPITVDRAADAAADGDAATVTVAARGDALRVERAATSLMTPVGRSVVTTVPLRAARAGDEVLQIAAQLGAHVDRSERDVRIGADHVARHVVAAGAGTGEVVVALPDGAAAAGAVRVDVLQGGAEAWRLLEADLAAYPYGCAEQTLSRLVPSFARVRAASARGDAPPALDDAFGKRLRAGLARLRELQQASGSFAFWPGGADEPAITGLVLHGLAALRDGGFDVAKSGLDLRVHHFHGGLPGRDGATVVDAAFVAAAERLAGCVRLWPQEHWPLRQLRTALAVLPQLPGGLCARMGLALHGAGDDAGARACRARLQAASLPVLLPDGFPGEDPLAVQALCLELDVALGAPTADRERAAAELLLACLRGGGSTYGRACALAALAAVLPRTAAAPGTVRVAVGAAQRELAIGGAASAWVHCELPRAVDGTGANAVVVRGPAGMPLLVRVVGERTERASDHAAWARPLHVERAWWVRRLDATWEEVREGRDLAPWTGAPRVGQPLVLRVVVTSPIAMRHVVVDCPLPAGFEVVGAAAVERFDDRVAFACDLAPGAPTVLRVDVVPTVTGRFVWPPASAAPMYVADHDGGTAGAFVEVVAVEPGEVPSLVVCFTTPAPEAPAESEPDPFGDCCALIERAFDPDEPFEPEPEREAEAESAAGAPDAAREGTPQERAASGAGGNDARATRDRAASGTAVNDDRAGQERAANGAAANDDRVALERAARGTAASGDEAARARAVATQLAVMARAEVEPWGALVDLARLVERCADVDAGLAPARAWRHGAAARLRAELVARTIAAFALPWPGEREEASRCLGVLRDALTAWPEGAAREPWLVAWWTRAVAWSADERARALLGMLPDVVRDPALLAVLCDLVVTAERDDARTAWDLLPTDARVALPPSVVVDVVGADHDGVLAWLAGTDAGRAELRARLRQTDFLRLHFAELEAALPSGEWSAVPLAAFAAAATARNAEALVARLVAAPFPTEELQSAFAAAVVPAWRFVVATVLRERGARAAAASRGTGAAPSVATSGAPNPAPSQLDGSAAPSDALPGPSGANVRDPLWSLWQRALALGADDAAGAHAVGTAPALLGIGPDLTGEADLLRAFVAPILARAATPELAYAAREVLDDDAWGALWARMSAGERLRLLALFQQRLPEQFAPATADEADALWRFLERTGDLGGAGKALLDTAAGVTCVRRQLDAGAAGTTAAAMRAALAAAFALDPATLQPPPGGELTAVLQRLARFGAAGPWSPADAPLLERLLRYRGL